MADTRAQARAKTTETATIGADSAQPLLDAQNAETGATTTDPRARARAADAGVKVDPDTGRVSQRGPAGPSLSSERVVAKVPMFVKLGADKRRLVGDDVPAGDDLVLYLRGDVVAPEHHGLPTVPAVHRHGVWEPEGT
jgi:hypothetical protein